MDQENRYLLNTSKQIRHLTEAKKKTACAECMQLTEKTSP